MKNQPEQISHPGGLSGCGRGDGHTLNATDKDDKIRSEQNFSVYLLWIARKTGKKKDKCALNSHPGGSRPELQDFKQANTLQTKLLKTSCQSRSWNH